MTRREFLSAPDKEALNKLVIREHRRDQMLRMRRHEAEAGHLASAADDGIIVGVDNTNSESREPHILGEAINDMDEIPVTFSVVFNDFGDTDEARLGKDSGSVDFVAHQVDVLFVDECDGGFQCLSVVHCAQWI